MAQTLDSINAVKVREPVLTYLKTLANIFNADACVLYDIVEDMHPEEKKIEFETRFEDSSVEVNGNTLTSQDHSTYDILKFIGVGEKDGAKNWTEDYEKRPDKYVVFKNCEECAIIPGEGLTGHSARIKKLMYYPTSEDINKSKARRQGDNDTENNIHPPCEKCLVVPIDYKISENLKRTVILRFDIYKIEDRSTNPDFPKEYVLQVIVDNKLSKKPLEVNKDSIFYKYLSQYTKTVLDQSAKYSKEQTYKFLFKGELLVASLTENHFRNKVSPTKNHLNKENISLNESIYKKLVHLFFVFNRRTYLRREGITNRTILFADELAALLFNNINYSFKEQLEQFKNHEDLMLYGTSSYRDHFMHQMHVFALGYLIINSIGFDQFTKRLRYDRK